MVVINSILAGRPCLLLNLGRMTAILRDLNVMMVHIQDMGTLLINRDLPIIVERGTTHLGYD